jgi:TonB family protein
VGHKARWEYFRAIYGRYQKGDRRGRQAILNEFCLNTGYHRKYAIRLLNRANPGPRANPSRVRRKRALSYGPKTQAVLTAVWEAAGYPWSVARGQTRTMPIPAPLFLRRGLLKKRVAEILRERSMSKPGLIALFVLSSLVLFATVRTAARILPLEYSAQEPNTAPIQIEKGGENLLHGVLPEYPRRALEKKIEGDVLLELSVDEQGKVSDARVLSGPEELRTPALQSVLQWHYGPPTPMPGTSQVLIHFQLPKEGAASRYLWGEQSWRVEQFQRGFRFSKLAGSELERLLGPPSEVTEREVKDALANPNTTPAERVALERRPAYLQSEAEHERHAPGARLERELGRLHDTLEDPNTSPEDRARLTVLFTALQRQMTEIGNERQRLHFDPTLKLTLIAVHREGVLDSAWKTLLSRLALRPGDTIDSATAERIKQTVSSFDEHFLTQFHPDGKGGVYLSVVAP